jgi:hypothetical protein
MAMGLTTSIARIGFEPLAASLAFVRVFHTKPSGCQRAAGLRKNWEEGRGRRRNKSFFEKSGKKTQRKKTEFQTARFPPLSFRR